MYNCRYCSNSFTTQPGLSRHECHYCPVNPNASKIKPLIKPRVNIKKQQQVPVLTDTSDNQMYQLVLNQLKQTSEQHSQLTNTVNNLVQVVGQITDKLGISNADGQVNTATDGQVNTATDGQVNTATDGQANTGAKNQVNRDGNINKDSTVHTSTDNSTNHDSHDNVVVNQYINFNQGSIDIFDIYLKKYGPEKAIGYTRSLVQGKDKTNKQEWLLNPDLVDLKMLKEVIRCSQPHTVLTRVKMETKNSDGTWKVISGSTFDRILSNIVTNAIRNVQNYANNYAIGKDGDEDENQAEEDENQLKEDENQLEEDKNNEPPKWHYIDMAGIYENKSDSLLNLASKFMKILPSGSYISGLVESL